MRVGHTAGIVIAVVMIAAITVGLGFALSPLYGYSYSENNTTGVSSKTIDILVGDGQGDFENATQLAANIEFPTYASGSTVAVPGDYGIVIKQGDAFTSGYVRLWCDMANDSSWVLIERMYVVYDDIVDAQGYQREFDFGVSTTNSQITTGVPTEAVGLDCSNRQYGVVPFTIYVEFKDFGYSVGDSGNTLSEFAGSKFVFAFDSTDPLS